MDKLLTALIYFSLLFLFLGCKETVSGTLHIKNEIRPPAYPLVMIDPGMNVWSMTDTLYHDHVRHSSGKMLPLVGALRVDGEVYRFMGSADIAMKPLAPMSKDGEWEGTYSFTRPGGDWMNPDFDDSQWRIGRASFGTVGELNVQTIWPTSEIWVRREVTLTDSILPEDSLILVYSHDEMLELYIDGIQVIKTGSEWYNNVESTIPNEIRSSFTDGKITIAAHCRNMSGPGFVDFGIYIKKSRSYLGRTAHQKSVDVQPTQTIYTFECGDVALKLSFISPFLATDLELVSAPFNYISYETASLDGKLHDIQLYFEASSLWVSNENKRMNRAEYDETEHLLLVKTGNTAQQLLDRHAAGWGYFCMGGEKQRSTVSTGHAATLREEFVLAGKLAGDTDSLRNATIAICQGATSALQASGQFIIGYDDILAISYFGDNLRPYWNRNGDKTIAQIFTDAHRKYDDISSRCRELDYEVMSKARHVGGKEYAELCALAYRQTIAGNKLVQGTDGALLYFNRELGVVDIFTASAPLFLYFNPALVKALMNPLFAYSESGKWPKAYPAHDLGIYPIVCHQDYFDLPVEEAGNMLILAAAVAAVEGDGGYAQKHWETLSQWNDYLLQTGIDTEEQPSTDNFSAPVSHNANLSVKVILGVASYAYMAKMIGKDKIAEENFSSAREMAAEWERLSNAGDHYRIAFDQADSTWSQKYNLVWDKALSFGIFPDSIYTKEIDYYKLKQHKYGLPLDSRNPFAKADWISWVAAMADRKEDFRELIKPLHRFMHETTDRVPMADLINTDTATHRGFTARSVVGAYYMQLLKEKIKMNSTARKELSLSVKSKVKE